MQPENVTDILVDTKLYYIGRVYTRTPVGIAFKETIEYPAPGRQHYTISSNFSTTSATSLMTFSENYGVHCNNLHRTMKLWSFITKTRNLWPHFCKKNIHR